MLALIDMLLAQVNNLISLTKCFFMEGHTTHTLMCCSEIGNDICNTLCCFSMQSRCRPFLQKGN